MRGEHAARGERGEKLLVNGARWRCACGSERRRGTSKQDNRTHRVRAYVVEGALRVTTKGTRSRPDGATAKLRPRGHEILAGDSGGGDRVEATRRPTAARTRSTSDEHKDDETHRRRPRHGIGPEVTREAVLVLEPPARDARRRA